MKLNILSNNYNFFFLFKSDNNLILKTKINNSNFFIKKLFLKIFYFFLLFDIDFNFKRFKKNKKFTLNSSHISNIKSKEQFVSNDLIFLIYIKLNYLFNDFFIKKIFNLINYRFLKFKLNSFNYIFLKKIKI